MARIKFKSMFLGLLLVAALGPAASAQVETGQITGRVTDPNGAVVPGAAVAVKSVETGAERAATTDEEGAYTVTNLQPGLYDVSVQAQNFAKSTQRVQVTVGAKASLETQLSVTELKGEQVVVVAGAGVEVNTQTQELSNVVSGEQIRALPTITRNPYDLVQLSGNAATDDPTTSQNDAGGTATFRGAGVSLNGQRAASTNILLDGADNNDVYRAQVGNNIPLDSVQEFRVISSNFSAEYGRATGGIVNVATRSGSNAFSGSAYEFNRVSRLASNGFDNNARGLRRGVFTRNQFGYSLGGPVVKDKAFFFNSTEWIRVRSTGPLTALVPTPELLAASSPATRAFFGSYQLAAAPTGRRLTASDLGVEGLSLPASTPVFQEVAYNVPVDLGGGNPQNAYQTVTRVDWNLNDRTQVYGRYALESQDLLQGVVGNSPYAGFNTGQHRFNQNALASLTRTFSANFVSQTKLAFNRTINDQPLGEQPAGPTLYLTLGRASFGGTLVGLPGYLPYAQGLAIPAGGPVNNAQGYQDFNLQRGNHQFRFGGQYVYIQINNTFGAFQNAVLNLGNSNETGLANLLAGQLFRFQGAADPQGHFPGEFVTTPLSQPSFSRSNRYQEWATYFNDSWRVRPTLTLNLGLRYEYYGVQHNKDPRLDSNFYFGQGSTLQERIRNGRVMIAEDSPVGGLWAPDRNNFAPRVGFAWDVTGDGRTSLRAGYGMAYERNFGNVTFNVIQNPPNYAVVAITAGNEVASLPLTADNAGPLAGSGTTIRLPGTSLRHVREDIRNAYAHFWSAAFERELGRGTVASAEYSGSAGRSLYSIENINLVGSGPVFLGSDTTTPAGDVSTRLNGQYTSINSRGNNGYSNSHALVLGLASNDLRHTGLQLTARYTYGVAKDNLSSTFSDANAQNGNLGILDPFNPSIDYGYADFDIRHRFVGSFNYEVPFFDHYTNGLAKNVLGGWTLTGIVNARTGLPFSVYDCEHANFICPRYVPSAAVSLSGSGSPPAADATTPNSFVYIALPPRVDYNNPLAGVSDVGPFPAAMTRRNAFRGPGYWNVDAGLYKRIRFSERYSLQLRLEAFNVLNHANLFFDPNQLDASGFDFVSARRGVFPSGNIERRNVQLAAKFIF
jgi:hypothetical protein